MTFFNRRTIDVSLNFYVLRDINVCIIFISRFQLCRDPSHVVTLDSSSWPGPGPHISSEAGTSSLTDLRPPDWGRGRVRSWQNKKLSAPGSRMKQGSDSRPVSGRRELHNKSNVITFTPVCILSIVEQHLFKCCLGPEVLFFFLTEIDETCTRGTKTAFLFLQIYRTICQKKNIYLKLKK